ncbi:MAG: hypothetical protein COZ57_38310 [Armatimonadetes bacterium CG_4_8_14_3_um_filter_66_20]|nr:MAG: hypothetical protein COZ57_38310 [Armatimonadetes bacterium CG_4_8_14_3_um_filter_66_20]
MLVRRHGLVGLAAFLVAKPQPEPSVRLVRSPFDGVLEEGGGCLEVVSGEKPQSSAVHAPEQRRLPTGRDLLGALGKRPQVPRFQRDQPVARNGEVELLPGREDLLAGRDRGLHPDDLPVQVEQWTPAAAK